MKPVEIIPARNTLGEGIQWDALGQTLWWTDIQARELLRCQWPAVDTMIRSSLPERLGSFGLCADGQRLIAAFESGIARYDLNRGTTEWLMKLPPMPAKVRFNDGRVDRQGRFWCGTMVEGDRSIALGQLFCTERQGEVQCREEGILISNGICWSPNSERFFFADSPRHEIYAFDFDAVGGRLSNRRVFARTPEGVHPDGADVDEEGGLWSAQWGAGQVARYTPDGKVDRLLKVPASQPTCVAFGGPDLKHLFVTSARDGLNDAALDAQPQAGNVFVFETDVRGLPSARFA